MRYPRVEIPQRSAEGSRQRHYVEMKSTSLERVLTQKNVTRAEKVRLVLSLSLPAILAQLTTIAMQYIDAGMVGSLGWSEALVPRQQHL